MINNSCLYKFIAGVLFFFAHWSDLGVNLLGCLLVAELLHCVSTHLNAPDLQTFIAHNQLIKCV